MRRRLVPRIVGGVLVLVILPFAALALAGGFTIIRGLDADLRASLSSVVAGTVIETERATRPIPRVLSTLALFARENTDPEDLRLLLDATQQSWKDLSKILVIGPDDRVLAAAPFDPVLLGLDYSGQPEYREARGSEAIVISRPFIPPQASQVVLAAYKRSGDLVFSLDLDLDELSGFLHSLRLSPADHIALVDGRGRMVASTEIAKVFEQVTVSPADLAAADLSSVVLDGERHLVLVREVPQNGWKAIYYRDEGQAHRIVRSFLFQLSAIALIALLGSVILALAAGRVLSRPLARIAEELDFVAKGHYERRVGDDWPLEFEMIANDFNNMAGELERRESALEASEALARHDRDEKVVLLKEIHHRVKNNLQIIVSLLHLQEDSLVDPRDVEMVRASEDRILSMSLTHEILYQSENFSAIDVEEYVRRLFSQLRGAYEVARLEFRLDSDHLRLPLDQATPLGLILNELATNAFKYALRNREDPRLEVSIRRKPAAEGARTRIIVDIRDNGPGLPEGFRPELSGSLGISLVTSLAHQLGGCVTWYRVDPVEGGLGVRIDFPEPVSTAT